MHVREQLDVWEPNVESLRTVGQLRDLVDAIGSMIETLSKDEASNAFRYLDISPEQVSRYAMRQKRRRYVVLRTNAESSRAQRLLGHDIPEVETCSWSQPE